MTFDLSSESEAVEAGRSGPLRLFLSYAHEDELLVVGLRAHLAPLRHEQILTFWWDREIRPGQDWDAEISTRLESSDIVIVLVSADLINSEYAYGRELGRALELQSVSRMKVVPVIARRCKWEGLPIAKLQALPNNALPIIEWPDRDSAYVSVVDGIEQLAREITSATHSLLDDWITSRLLRRRVIRTVQERLAGLQLYAGPIDGDPGPLTEAAVRHLQRDGEVRVDGRIGPDVIRLVMATPAPSLIDDGG